MSSPCVTPLNFPDVIANRPSLPRIEYRIGRYSDFRASMLSTLDRSPLLQGWTHREPDDPAIALLEGAAILGDILTFYQELYANEAWLRTATWPQSIKGLLRLIGYRPAPGLGGSGYVAFEINGNSPAEVPAGFPFSAQLSGAAAPADFETSANILALPSISRFSLYARSAAGGIHANQSFVAAEAADLAGAGVSLKAKDRLMLVADSDPALRQIAVVTSVATVLDQTIITIAGAWRNGDVSGTLTAYKLGRTFRAFGYNAPASQFALNTSNTLTSTPVETTLGLNTMLQGFPLERQVDDLSAGITMLLDLEVSRDFDRFGPTNVFRKVTALSVRSDTDSVGPLQGGITRVAFEPPPSGGGLIYSIPEYADRRKAICYEVAGQGFRVASPRQVLASADSSELDYLGEGASYEALDGRLLQFVALNPDDTAARVEEATVSINRGAIGDGGVAVRTLTLAPALTQFTPADFPLSNPSTLVFGNVAPMTQGKTQPVAVLGNGDARQINQSLPLQKPPLTWLPNEALTPPRQPQVKILVNQIEWTQIDSLFASGPKDQVYILREDFSGKTWVRFGDGVNGAVVPSGVGNVTAQFRTGNGANGWRQSGAKPQANGRVPNLAQIHLYDELTGGTVDEEPSHARQSGPGRIEELGRIVSLSDFEYEALAQPGVEKALAVWDTDENVPLIKVTALLSDDTPAQLSSVQAALSEANAERGADRVPVLVVDASLEYIYVATAIGLRHGYQPQPVLAAVRLALGVVLSDGSGAPAGGLLSVDRRDLGQEEYASRIEGAIQNVEGVAWVKVTALGALGIAEDPSTLSIPSTLTLSRGVPCANNRVLALYQTHFLAAIGDS
jgi:hypothetical protein